MAMKFSAQDLRLICTRFTRQSAEISTRMAKSLHDDACQKLAALSIELSLLEKELLATDPARARRVSQLLPLTSQINQCVRQVMNDLRPKILEAFGLVAAIQSECRRREKESGRAIAFSATSQGITLTAEMGRDVFTIFLFGINLLHEHADDLSVMVNTAEKTGQFSIKLLGRPRRKNVLQKEEFRLTLVTIQVLAEQLAGTARLEEKQEGLSSLVLDFPIPALAKPKKKKK